VQDQFVLLLLVYRDDLGLSAATAQATFGLYAAGLVPGLLLGGPFSDRHGRPPVLIAALVASVLASGLLLIGAQGVGWLFAGRLMAGIASGAAFSTGAAWLKELSLEAAGARRATGGDDRRLRRESPRRRRARAVGALERSFPTSRTWCSRRSRSPFSRASAPHPLARRRPVLASPCFTTSGFGRSLRQWRRGCSGQQRSPSHISLASCRVGSAVGRWSSPRSWRCLPRWPGSQCSRPLAVLTVAIAPAC
jgi:hypothetical protein